MDEAAMACFRAGLITNTSGRGTEEIHYNYHAGDPGMLLPAFWNYCYINILDLFQEYFSHEIVREPVLLLLKIMRCSSLST
jgi:hypothetical protein